MKRGILAILRIILHSPKRQKNVRLSWNSHKFYPIDAKNISISLIDATLCKAVKIYVWNIAEVYYRIIDRPLFYILKPYFGSRHRSGTIVKCHYMTAATLLHRTCSDLTVEFLNATVTPDTIFFDRCHNLPSVARRQILCFSWKIWASRIKNRKGQTFLRNLTDLIIKHTAIIFLYCYSGSGNS